MLFLKRIALLKKMKLPNGARAVVEIGKLRDYCLSAQHPEGRHKARVFLSALGMAAQDAGGLREILLSAAVNSPMASVTSSDEYGCRYSVDMVVSWGSRAALVRSAWIIKTGEDFPRLVSCYVLRGDA
jgi:hypothetical protein